MHSALRLSIIRFSLARLSTTRLTRTSRFSPSSIAQVRTMSTATAAPDSVPLPPPITFPKSPIPKNPLGEGKFIRTAAALIIGYADTFATFEILLTRVQVTRYLMARLMTEIRTSLLNIVLNMGSTCMFVHSRIHSAVRSTVLMKVF